MQCVLDEMLRLIRTVPLTTRQKCIHAKGRAICPRSRDKVVQDIRDPIRDGMQNSRDPEISSAIYPRSDPR